MMKNSLNDLSNYLFESIERLQDDSLTEEELDREVKRAHAVKDTASVIIQTADMTIKAKRLELEYGIHIQSPLLIETDKGESYVEGKRG